MNEGYRKAEEQFPEGLGKWSYGNFTIMMHMLAVLPPRESKKHNESIHE